MKLVIYVFLLFLFQICIAQNDGPYEVYYDEGQIKTVGQHKNGERVGKWKGYHANGNIREEYSFTNDKKNKETKCYFKDGSLSFELYKIDGFYLQKEYYRSGELRFENQLENGYFKEYYKNGAIKISSNYRDLQLHGLWVKYFPDGSTEWEVEYFNGFKHGYYKLYYANNQLKLEGKLKKGKKEGEELQYYENGQLEWNGNFKVNQRVKKWLHFDRNGSKIETIRFKNGKNKNGPKLINVPYGHFERVPVYPGCENQSRTSDSRKCMSRKIAEFVMKKFNKDAIVHAPVEGWQRISVIFKINKLGNVIDVKARAKHQIIEAEAIRVIKLLPKMTPGERFGKTVIVPYSLPITFFMK